MLVKKNLADVACAYAFCLSPSVVKPVANLGTDGVHPALHLHARLGLELVRPLRHDDAEDELHFLLIMGALGREKIK